jgi:CheY-like chemotaxis protein
VAEGLLAPYRMELHTCTGGLEAIELVKRYTYDIIFMDHMMPGMDGIETTALIREWEKSRNAAKEIPIIALTANAISGMKEMFLLKGFNDYLSKPIEITKLDEILALWIPGDKQQRDNNAFRQKPDETEAAGSLVISGVDTAKGIAMTGGTLSGYRQVLDLFRKDVEERLPFLRNFLAEQSRAPEAENLTVFVTQVHALKSASASIGAAEVSVKAAALEAAGKAGDMAAIAETLPVFAVQLAALAEGISAAMSNNEELGMKNETPLSFPTFHSSLLEELAAALEAQNAGDIDRLLEELNGQTLDSQTRETVDQISDNVLMAEYGKALEAVKGLTRDGTGGFSGE